MEFGNDIRVKGYHTVEHIRGGKVIGKYIFPNGVTNQGKNYALDAAFNGATQVTSWYLGLIDNASYSALAAADTPSSHAGWIEFTSYDEATRPEWLANAASGQAVTNTTVTTFTISASGTLKGVFLASVNTKSSTAGTLWATALFTPSTIAVVDNDVIRNTYTVTAT